MPSEQDQIDELIPFRRDHLLMTVGGNTLPNAVAGPLLVNDGGTITLIHSTDTHNIAESLLKPVLEDRCRGRHVTVQLALKSVDESDPGHIQQVVTAEVKRARGSVGLHYTGGTKAMSVHTYREVDRLKAADALFSYINHRKLQMVLEEGTRVLRPINIGLVTVPFRQMLHLHGGDYNDPSTVPVTDPIWYRVAESLAGLNCRGNSRDWTRWKNAAIYPWSQANRPIPGENWIDRGNRVESALQGQTSVPLNGLRDAQGNDIQCPPSVESALRQELNFGGDAIPLRAASTSFGGAHPISAVYEWLDGKWLEHWALGQLKIVLDSLSLHDVEANVLANRNRAAQIGLNGSPGFEIDVVAVRGYQLFVISCGTDSRHAKTKLFEAFTRARQMGGDEARVALLTTTAKDESDRLIHEASELLLTKGQLKVFGKSDLLSLPTLFEEWMTT